MLQDQVEPGPVEDVAEVLQRELGAPASQLFAEFEPEARAAASLAQVLPPMHACMGTSVCVHHAATCSLMLVPAYVCTILPNAALCWYQPMFPSYCHIRAPPRHEVDQSIDGIDKGLHDRAQ